MKKLSMFILCSVFAVNSVMANEQKKNEGTGLKVNWVSIGGEVGNSKNKLTDRTATSYSTSFLVGLSNGLVLEARTRSQQTNKTDKLNYGPPMSWTEFGVSKSYNIGPTNVYGRILVGTQLRPNDRFNWHAQEVGITDRFGKTPFGYILGYRTSDSFSANKNVNNQQMRYTLYYNINRNHRLSVRFTDQRGDTPSSMTNFGYSYRF
jgi:hypothetical protein